MRRFAAGGFVGATWATWTVMGPPPVGTAVLIGSVLVWLLWPELRWAWAQVTT
jgi:hypothetical protein